jgi:exodeoxyribonuclease-1
VAKLIKQHAPEIWNSLYDYRTKAAAIRHLMDTSVLTTTGFNYGKSTSKIVTALEANPNNTGQMLVYDLQNEPEPLMEMADNELSVFLASKLKPVVPIKVNAGPILLPFDLAGPSCEGFYLGMSELQRRAELIRDDVEFIDRITEVYLASQEPYPESEYVEEQIFGGFYTALDQDRIDGFHAADWNGRFTIANEFDDPRLKTLALRLVYNEARQVLPDNLRSEYDRAIAKRLLVNSEDTKVSWTTFENAFSQAEKLLEVNPDNTLIRDHLDHLKTKHQEFSMMLNV